MKHSSLVSYENKVADLWEQMVRIIGVHSVTVLMERAVWEASKKHPELALIQTNDDGLSFAALGRRYNPPADDDIAEAFNDLTTELLLILARLLGKEAARRQVEELEAVSAQEMESAKREFTK